MSKQVVLITGALTGIGRATAMAFAVAGANVVVAGRREEDGKKLEKELREVGVEAQFVKADAFRWWQTPGHLGFGASRL
jgi:NAD(P)-dependent dehydrogenase (short-subunit alcohol dehydrogenase family)